MTHLLKPTPKKQPGDAGCLRRALAGGPLARPWRKAPCDGPAPEKQRPIHLAVGTPTWSWQVNLKGVSVPQVPWCEWV